MSFAKGAAALLGFVFSLAVITTPQTALASIVTRSEARFAPTLNHELSRQQEARLEQSLRRLTGFYALSFSASGELLLNEQCAAVGGSATARELLRMALEPERLFIIEDYSQSPLVHFGQLDEGLNYSDDSCAHTQMQVWRLRLDFRDFAAMQAAPEVRESFDEGITLLHELLHGFGLKDARTREELGDCEQIVNQVRAEIGLPLRDTYFGEQQRNSSWVSTVRLKFKSRVQRASGSRWKSHYLFFLAERRAE